MSSSCDYDAIDLGSGAPGEHCAAAAAARDARRQAVVVTGGSAGTGLGDSTALRLFAAHGV